MFATAELLMFHQSAETKKIISCEDERVLCKKVRRRGQYEEFKEKMETCNSIFTCFNTGDGSTAGTGRESVCN